MQVRVEATDDEEVSRIRIYLDGEEAGTTSSRPYIINVDVSGKKDNLSHVIQAAATDKSDNTGYSTLVRFTIARSTDITNPEVAIVNPQDGQQVEGTVKIVAFADDDYSVKRVVFFIDGDSVGQSIEYPYTYNWNTTEYADSTNHTIFVRAFDDGDNWSVSEVITVTVYPSTDLTPPTALLTYPADGQIVYDTIQVTVEASDNKGVTMVEYFVDGLSVFVDTEAPYIFAWDTRPYANDGEHSIYAKAYDAAGNTSTSGIISVVIPSGISDDITPPTARITYPVGGSTVSGTVTVTVDVNDNVGVTQVQYFMDGQPVHTADDAPWSFTWNTASVADGGSHTLFVRVYDAAGNSTASDLITLTVADEQILDVTAPVAFITYPTDGSVHQGNVDITIDASDENGIDRVDFYIDGDSTGSDSEWPYVYTWNTLTEDDGIHTIYAKAYDPYGNMGITALISVTVTNQIFDVEAPVITLLYPVTGTTVSGTVSVAADVDDNVGVTRVEFYVDGILRNTDTSAPWSYGWDTTAEENREHTIYLKAYDAAGNVGNSVLLVVTTSN